MQVIVLGGIARVGKTEVADILEMEAAMLGKNPKRLVLHATEASLR